MDLRDQSKVVNLISWALHIQYLVYNVFSLHWFWPMSTQYLFKIHAEPPVSHSSCWLSTIHLNMEIERQKITGKSNGDYYSSNPTYEYMMELTKEEEAQLSLLPQNLPRLTWLWVVGGADGDWEQDDENYGSSHTHTYCALGASPSISSSGNDQEVSDARALSCWGVGSSRRVPTHPERLALLRGRVWYPTGAPCTPEADSIVLIC